MVFAQAVFGVWLIASALQGYMLVVGDLCRNAVMQWPIRAMLIIAGMTVAVPGGGPVPLSNAELSVLGLFMGIPAVALAWWINRNQPPEPVSNS